MKSSCCGAELHVFQAGEGTCHYDCMSCGKPCDAVDTAVFSTSASYMGSTGDDLKDFVENIEKPENMEKLREIVERSNEEQMKMIEADVERGDSTFVPKRGAEGGKWQPTPGGGIQVDSLPLESDLVTTKREIVEMIARCAEKAGPSDGQWSTFFDRQAFIQALRDELV